MCILAHISRVTEKRGANAVKRRKIHLNGSHLTTLAELFPVFSRRDEAGAAMTSPVFPMSRNFCFDEFGFDYTEMDYGQALEEARKHDAQEVALESKDYNNNLYRHQSRTFRRPDLVAGIPRFPAHLKTAGLQTPVENHKTRGSWKKSLLFWKKSHKKHRAPYSGIPAPQRPGFKSRSKSPIYTNFDIHSSPLTGTGTPTRQGEAEVPYVLLNHLSNSVDSRRTPIYLVT